MSHHQALSAIIINHPQLSSVMQSQPSLIMMINHYHLPSWLSFTTIKHCKRHALQDEEVSVTDTGSVLDILREVRPRFSGCGCRRRRSTEERRWSQHGSGRSDSSRLVTRAKGPGQHMHSRHGRVVVERAPLVGCGMGGSPRYLVQEQAEQGEEAAPNMAFRHLMAVKHLGRSGAVIRKGLGGWFTSLLNFIDRRYSLVLATGNRYRCTVNRYPPLPSLTIIIVKLYQ